ncbi:MAG: DUF3487 family protein [Pedobacter sp.]
MADDEVLLPSELDEELPVLGGATLPELFQLGVLLGIFNFIIGILIGLFFLEWVVIIVLVFFIFGTALGVWLTSSWLKKFKRGKAPGYFLQRMNLVTSKLMGKPSKFLTRNGYWHGNRL